LDALGDRQAARDARIHVVNLVDVHAVHRPERNAVRAARTIERAVVQADARKLGAGGRAERVDGRRDRVRAGQRGDRREFPPVDEVPGKAGSAGGQHRLPQPVDGEAMTLIEGRRTLVQRIVSIEQGVVVAVGDVPTRALFVAIVDSVRPGVVDLRREALGHALLELHRQRVVPGLGAVFHLQDTAVAGVGTGGVGEQLGGECAHLIARRVSMTFDMNVVHWRSPNGIQTQAVLTGGAALGNNGNSTVETRNGKAAWTSVVTPNSVNELRFGWFKDRLSDPGASQLWPSTGATYITVAGSTVGAAQSYPRTFPSENRYQIVDNYSWTRGAHTAKFGMDFSTTQDWMNQLFNQFGGYSFSNLTNFARDFT